MGLENLGYRHGEHCIFLNSSDDIFDLLADMKKDITKYQHIADQGRMQTLDHHSAAARSKQLKESFERILLNSFSGSYWENGIYQLS